MKENCYISRASDDIDMKLGQVTKIDRQEKQNNVKKNLTMMSCQQIVMSFSFFRFMANLEQSGTWISDAYSANIRFLLKKPFILQKLK